MVINGCTEELKNKFLDWIIDVLFRPIIEGPEGNNFLETLKKSPRKIEEYVKGNKKEIEEGASLKFGSVIILSKNYESDLIEKLKKHFLPEEEKMVV